MKKLIFAFMLLFIGIQPAFSQTLGEDDQTAAADEDGLEDGEIPPSLRLFPFQWVDLTEPVKEAKTFSPEAVDIFIAFSTDEAVDTIQMGMTFEYFGEKYTTCHIVTNGFIALGTDSKALGSLIGPNSYSPSGIPSPRLPNNIVAPLWVDIDFANSQGYIFYRTFHPEKNNKSFDHLVVQWEDAGLFHDFRFGSKSVRVTFQAVLFAEGGLLFQYKTIDAGGLRDEFELYQQLGYVDPSIDTDSVTDFDLIRDLSNLSIGYEDKGGIKGTSWDFSVSSGTALGNELVPEWASGANGSDNFLNIIDGRDRRNNAVTGTSGGGCFVSQKKVSSDR